MPALPLCVHRHCSLACEKFRKLSLHHQMSVIVEKKLCAYCLCHSNLEAAKMRECIKRSTRAHWLGSKARDPRTLSWDRELPLVEQKAGRTLYACGANISVKTTADSWADSYRAELATLFDTRWQMLAIVTEAAIGQGLG
jgi:hypothetical protein